MLKEFNRIFLGVIVAFLVLSVASALLTFCPWGTEPAEAVVEDIVVMKPAAPATHDLRGEAEVEIRYDGRHDADNINRRSLDKESRDFAREMCRVNKIK